MLKNRTATTEIGGRTFSVSVKRGCPQGGVLSPLLWTMVVDNLLTRLNRVGLFTQGYADDIVILLTGKDLYTLGGLMQNALSVVENWCTVEGLSVNPSKTSLVLFTNKRSVNNLPSLNLFGQSLTWSEQVKYLGIILDRKLSWNAHLSNRIDRAIVSFWQCRRAFGKTWGLSPRILHWIYTAIIRPMLTFASVVWWPKTEKQYVKGNLEKIQRLACIGITGAMRNAPTLALGVLSGLTPLDIHVETMAKRTAYRLYCGGTWVCGGRVVGHGRILNRLRTECPEMNMNSDAMPMRLDFSRPVNIAFPKREDWTGESPVWPPERGVRCYTDGSLSDGRAGAGFFLTGDDMEEVNRRFPLGNYCSIFQAEVFAIIACTNEIASLGLHDKNIFIFSDSQAALKALDNPRTDSKIVSEC